MRPPSPAANQVVTRGPTSSPTRTHRSASSAARASSAALMTVAASLSSSPSPPTWCDSDTRASGLVSCTSSAAASSWSAQPGAPLAVTASAGMPRAAAHSASSA
ncbi:hypothetical protein MF672_020145 [Actinomadura sp. ATCC 31491]|uniref:Uncharacterized protein n=1 Tax=Actinomadura luzonensis TaxID=2805427 RepID=A0ABT0FUT5_9ACTN|nr:hypothetical protein [Actinomadura luzonensis]MCK2216092.1 hypothetical protein [Actinomadura luzonensis]